MATKEQLIYAAASRISKKLADAESKDYDENFTRKEAIMSCQNTRLIKIYMMLSKNSAGAETFYKYEFVNHKDNTDHFTLLELAEKVLLIGYANGDLSGNAPKDLIGMGFSAEKGTNMCAVSNMLKPDNYRLVITDEMQYNQEQTSITDEAIFYRENLTVFDVIVAHRYVRMETLASHETANN